MEFSLGDSMWNQLRKNAQDTDKYPIVGNVVSGLLVRSDVPNLSSIDASFNESSVLPNIREVSMSYFEAPPEVTEYTKELAQQIKNSGEISPLIVAVDSEGPYILEGAHRYDALKILGVKSFPAVVVYDLD